MTKIEALTRMNRERQIDFICDALCRWAQVGDSYIHDLMRVKEAQNYGTLTIDDFQEWDESRCLEVATEFVDWLNQPAEGE